MREQTKLDDLERQVKTLEDIISSFKEPLVEATPIQTLARTIDLNSRMKRHCPTHKTSHKKPRKSQRPSGIQGLIKKKKKASSQ
ncbi:hypothetical protein ACFX12_014979 [Malus domestica]